MPWTPPSDPVTSTVITVAYAVANLLTQIRWLRLMTGNADPPGSNYVVVADTTSATTWRKVPSDAIADGAITDAKLQTPKVSRSGDVMTGDLNINRGGGADGYLTLGAGTAHYLGWDGGKFVFSPHPVQVPGPLTAAVGLTSIGDIMAYRGAGTTGFVVLGNNPAFYIGWDGTNIVTHTGKVWTAGNDGPGSGLDADTVAGKTPTATPTANALPLANASGKLDAWVTSGSTDAVSVGGRVPTATPTANAIPIADAGGKLDAWVTGGAGAFVPSGLIALWVASDTPPTGWVFETTFTQKFVVGANNGVTGFHRNDTGGAATHDHGFGTSHTGGSVAADASTPIRVQVSGTGTDPQAPQSGHGHGFTNPGAHTVTSASLNHLPPYIAAHYIRKT
jgi:hypothetical protein